MQNNTIHTNYFYFAMLIILAIASYLMIKPFLTPILGSVIAAYLFYPLYCNLKKKIKNENLAAIIVALLMIIVFTLPLFLFVNSVVSEAGTLYLQTKKLVVSGNLEQCGQQLCLPEFLQQFITNPQVKQALEQTTSNLASLIIKGASSFLISIPLLFINIFVALILTIYIFKDGCRVIEWVKRITPFKKNFKEKIFKQIRDITSAVIHGQFLIAIVIGLLGGIIFFALGLNAPVLWGMVMAILSFLPVIGAPIVWLPTSLILIISGFISKNLLLIWKGIALLLYGAVLMSGMIENYLKPRIVGEKAKVHPVIILVGVVGGISLFGVIGLVVGPIILALLVTFLNVYGRSDK